MLENFLILLAFLMMSFGIIGIFIPLLPGVPLAWLGLLIYALATDFTTIPILAIFIFLFLTLLTIVIDIAAPIIGAKKYDASKYGLTGAVLGFLIGIMTLGPIGIIAGPLLGAFTGELFAGKNSDRAARSAKGVILGFLAGSLLKLIVILIMTGFLLLSFF